MSAIIQLVEVQGRWIQYRGEYGIQFSRLEVFKKSESEIRIRSNPCPLLCLSRRVNVCREKKKWEGHKKGVTRRRRRRDEKTIKRERDELS